MLIPYSPRVDERAFPTLPGFHGGAYVIAYVEDTSARGVQYDDYCEPDCTCCPHNFEPRMILEIADCDNSIRLGFDVDTPAGRANSQHKLDTLIAALRVFRAGVVAEFEPYDRRERELAELEEKEEPGGPHTSGASRSPHGDVAQWAERLACNEVTRVRILSSPLPVTATQTAP